MSVLEYLRYMVVGHLIKKISGEKKNRINFENGGKENSGKDFFWKKKQAERSGFSESRGPETLNFKF